MPFHVFLAQSLSLITGGLSVWKVGKDVFLAAAVLLVVTLVMLQRKATKTFWVLAALTGLYGLTHLAVWLANSEIYRQTALLGTAYNVRVLAYAVLGAGATLLAPKFITEKKLIRILLLVSAVVAALGVLQYVLPTNTMSHFGYSLSRGVRPTFFIDDKPDLPRIMSTMRDPNSLAAYFILPLCLGVSAFASERKRRVATGALIGILSLAAFLTFSRGGLLGLFVAVAVLVVLRFRAWLWKHALPIGIVTVVAMVALGGLGYALRDQYVVQNIILHSDETTKATEDSNDLHLRLARDGFKGIVDQPLGHGPGTAGIVSIQNPDKTVLTENYYAQIGYEVGVFGLALFVGTWGYVGNELCKRAGPLAAALLASGAAYVLLSMIMHLWTNEAVAAQWWLVAGMVLGANRTFYNSRT